MILTNVEPSDTGIRLEDHSTHLFMDNDDKGVGTLYVSEGDIRWVNSSGVGITLDYPSISIFAVSTDREKFQEDCLYLLVKDEDKPVSEDEDDELDIDYSGEVEIRIIPSDGVAVHDLFRAVQECNKLHPCENDDMISENSEEDSEESDGHDSEDVAMVSNGDHVPGQFDDAD